MNVGTILLPRRLARVLGNTVRFDIQDRTSIPRISLQGKEQDFNPVSDFESSFINRNLCQLKKLENGSVLKWVSKMWVDDKLTAKMTIYLKKLPNRAWVVTDYKKEKIS